MLDTDCCATTWPDGADPRAAYRCWTLNADEEVAAASFKDHYDRPPEFIFVAGGLLRVGPVPEARRER